MEQFTTGPAQSYSSHMFQAVDAYNVGMTYEQAAPVYGATQNVLSSHAMEAYDDGITAPATEELSK